MKTLLEHVFVQPEFDKEKTCVFVYQFGNHKYRVTVPDIEIMVPGSDNVQNVDDNLYYIIDDK